jgi:chitin synthase
VDEEDYYVVGDGSIHYVGYPNPSPEKAALQYDYQEKYSERGYLTNGQPVVFDPEPETPTSTLNTLPPETPLETRHFGPAPTGRAVRRHKTKRRVQLTNGNLVVDLQVPPKLVLPWRGNSEMTETRYTAVTCDPDDFEKKGFFLRQNESGRRTELFIVITMYNVGRLSSPSHYSC